MKIHRIITATTFAVAAFGAGSVGAADYASPTDPPPPTIDDLVVADDGRAESTTCEGNVNCRLLEGACDLVGGTYTGWDSRDHGHTHGICTWPWE